MKSWQLWDFHPAITSHTDRSLGDRAADKMKAVLATWPAFFATLGIIATWIAVNPAWDRFPYILLNLCLSCFAAMQCFVLLIANKRGEAIAAALAQHTFELSQQIKELLEKNTSLTEEIHSLTASKVEVVS